MTSQTSPFLSLPLAQGNYPFALDKAQLKMTGDEWAWKFLRLNPGYRRDYELLRNRPALLTNPGKPLPHQWRDSEWFEKAKEFDVRYFSQNGKVLGPQCEWPHATALTLKELLEANPDTDPSGLRVRDFDSARLYGIGDWFDPSAPVLPKLDKDQSWFFHLTEPIFSVGKPFFAGRKSVWEISPRGNRISVGYTGEANLIESPVVYGRIESDNDRGERVITFGRIDSLPQQRALEVRDNDGKLIRSIDAPTITSFQLTGLARESEMVFAVSLDGNLKPQMRANQEAARHFQELMCRASSLHVANYSSTDPEPQVFSFQPNRAVAIPFGAVRTALSDLAREPASTWQNWHVVLIDVAYSLSPQFKAVEEQLQSIQVKLRASKRLANPIRRRAGTTDRQEFWLKRALCMVELQLGLPKRANSPTGADRIANAIYDQTDPYHKTIWGERGWEQCSNRHAPESEKFKDALRTGIDLVMHQYTFLIGAAPIDLDTDAPLD